MKLGDRPDPGPRSALYAGWCVAGADSIEPGEEIVSDGDGWSHVECAITPRTTEQADAACSRCNLVHAGDCW